MNTNETDYPRILPGQVVATPGAIEAMRPIAIRPSLSSPATCGATRATYRRLNDEALAEDSRLLSAYITSKSVRLWVITEAVGNDGRHSSTCLLLPREY